ncbi:polysaccharide deacetylase [Pelotomaculum terephthalicicum JT]|uniref:polysaccharide deacetylase family protein n=1 Tax=Pelotomaculum TaxID=191373 RepID=UPI0009D18169|nr:MULTISPECIES: polysaccharide deacetylase family protein [Pelotomaculum]MCG9967684.1 polysaccharide deacetylase [Pelotomaculum terephthalicicum JT]OPX84022.1 MAG: Peptidoglycan-N-acetylglucosamine deacetylase [Pelotomaculum sp. PtaB.Bin117]OPY61484.1 MAG: Peptidoglycan-N-acetylglucosamine deacetylase [Pelotomaculum sp. PtaU1.Bin065]
MFYKCSIPLFIVLILLANCTKSPLVAMDSRTGNSAQVEVSNQLMVLEQAAADRQPVDNSSTEPAKYVYLTFDDGPNSHYTGIILDILKKYDVKASFVVIGSNIEKNPEVLKRIVNEGHGLVNHTFSHDYNKIYASPRAFLEDLQKCAQAITALTEKNVKVFRAPGGPAKLNKNIDELLSKNGYLSLGWNVSAADTDPNGATPEQVYGNVANGVVNMERMKRVPIILMHDGTEINLSQSSPGTATLNYIKNRESDVAALPKIIEFLQARGYSFAIVDEKTPSVW